MIISFTNTHANAHPASQVQHLEAMVQHLEEYLQTYPHQPEETEKGEDKDEAETDEEENEGAGESFSRKFPLAKFTRGEKKLTLHCTTPVTDAYRVRGGAVGRRGGGGAGEVQGVGIKRGGGMGNLGGGSGGSELDELLASLEEERQSDSLGAGGAVRVPFPHEIVPLGNALTRQTAKTSAPWGGEREGGGGARGAGKKGLVTDSQEQRAPRQVLGADHAAFVTGNRDIRVEEMQALLKMERRLTKQLRGRLVLAHDELARSSAEMTSLRKIIEELQSNATKRLAERGRQAEREREGEREFSRNFGKALQVMGQPRGVSPILQGSVQDVDDSRELARVQARVSCLEKNLANTMAEKGQKKAPNFKNVTDGGAGEGGGKSVEEDLREQLQVLRGALSQQLQDALSSKNDTCSKLRAAERRIAELQKKAPNFKNVTDGGAGEGGGKSVEEQLQVLRGALSQQLQDALSSKNDTCSKLRAAERRIEELQTALQHLQMDLARAESARKASGALAEEFRLAMENAKKGAKRGVKAADRRAGRRERGAAQAAHEEWEQKLDVLAQRLSLVTLEHEKLVAVHAQEKQLSKALAAERKSFKAMAASVASDLSGVESHRSISPRTRFVLSGAASRLHQVDKARLKLLDRLSEYEQDLYTDATSSNREREKEREREGLPETILHSKLHHSAALVDTYQISLRPPRGTAHDISTDRGGGSVCGGEEAHGPPWGGVGGGGGSDDDEMDFEAMSTHMAAGVVIH
jgi:hypothetical protein